MFLYVSLLGAAKGMENGFDKLFSGFATNSIFLWAQKTSIPYEGFPKGREVHLQLSDMDMLKRKVSAIDYISPQNARGSFTGTPGESMSRNGKNGTYSLTGDYAVGNKISEKKLIFGRYLNDADVMGNKNVVVIGEEIYKNFFDAKKKENPVGKQVNIKGLFFNVIGVFRVKKGGGFENDRTAFIPLSTYTKMYNAGEQIDMFAIVSKPNANVNGVEEDVKLVLKTKNKVSPEDTNAFGSFNLGKEFKKLTGFLTGMQLLTIIVGTLTILAGVIAISNILLITVKERTKEIGIRRALGAKPAEVRNQILLESVVITLSSGILGFMCGIFVLIILNMVTQNQDEFPFYNPTVNYGNVFGAMAVMVILGLIIGMIPAQRAVKIRPIEALRSE
jgi:putative ABC transport system permease protein